MAVTLGQQYNVGEKPTVILYTYINHHAEPPIITKHKHCCCSTIIVPSNHTRIGAWVNSKIVGEKSTSILYKYSINGHTGISHKNRRHGKLGLQLNLSNNRSFLGQFFDPSWQSYEISTVISKPTRQTGMHTNKELPAQQVAITIYKLQ